MFINRIQYEAIFTRNGQEVFRAVNVVGFAGVFTGFKQGHFGIELNTRYPETIEGNAEMLDNLLLRKRPLSAWLVRKHLEDSTDYRTVVADLKVAQLTATQFFIISGV